MTSAPPAAPPAGFDAFWASTLDELGTIEPGLVTRPGDGGVTELEFTSLGGARIGGYLARADGTRPRPLVVHGHGYVSSGVEISRRWVREGVDVCGIDVRGYGRSASALAAEAPGGYVLTGAGSPEGSVLRGAVCDFARGIEMALELGGASVSRLIVQGTSFAGGLATAAEALRPRADLLALRVPSLAWHEARIESARSGSGLELRRHLEAHPEEGAGILETLDHFDALHFAPRVRCPTLVGVGDQDPVVPARTVLALFERLGGPRELMRFPVSHTQSPEEAHWLRFEQRWLELASVAIH
jgi:cephalosporin-C deacetylase